VPWLDADPRATLRVGEGTAGIRRVEELLCDLDRSGVRPGPGWEQQ
jgi:dihydroneopterin aldolase/2-amino-4-hydroxy-6-hydroxymethyldihydropteridine diphosphokinase